jgi:hypothetical protein
MSEEMAEGSARTPEQRKEALAERVFGSAIGFMEILNAWCEIWVHHPNKSAKANRGRPNCSLSQMQKLCRATLAAKRARNPLSS